MFTLYWITLRPTQKPYRIGLLFTYEMLSQFLQRTGGAAGGARSIGLAFATLSLYCKHQSEQFSVANKTCYSNLICGYSLLTLLNDVCNILVFGEYMQANMTA